MNRFTDEEKRFILENAERMTPSEIIRALGRSKGGVFRFLYTHNIKFKRERMHWTTNEENHLRRIVEVRRIHGMNIPIKKLAEGIFSHRTYIALKDKIQEIKREQRKNN